MRDAATVLLMRECEGGLEVLMMRRGATLSFMAGMWVFPGGRMDDADRSPAALARVLPADLEHVAGGLRGLLGERLPPATAAGLRIAACREAFEEAGVLLACDRGGAACEPRLVDRLQSRRPEVVADAGVFVRMLEEEELYLDLGPLVYWSHWITPSIEPKRFDTRFFVVPVPPDQSVSADLPELTEHAWVNPANVAAAIERGEIKVVPPTLLTLEGLAESYARHRGRHAMLAAEGGRPTPPVMPRIEVLPESVRVVMPWDPGYGDVAGEGLQVAENYPPHFTRRRSSLTVVARQREVRQRRRNWGRGSDGYTYWLEAIGDPEKDGPRLREVSPSQLVDRIKVPILLIHGTQDDIVPIAQSRAMKKALQKAGRKAELIEMKGEGHSYWSDENEMLALSSIDAFLWSNLGAGYGSTTPPAARGTGK